MIVERSESAVDVYYWGLSRLLSLSRLMPLSRLMSSSNFVKIVDCHVFIWYHWSIILSSWFNGIVIEKLFRFSPQRSIFSPANGQFFISTRRRKGYRPSFTSSVIPLSMDPGRSEWTGAGTRQIFWRTQTQAENKATWRMSAASFIMDGRHPERLPRHAAQPISSADSGECSVAARRSWSAPGLSAATLLSPPQQFTVYKVGYWKCPINQQAGCFGGSIVLHMHRISLGIVGFERKGGEAVELWNA
jgi:hypothetical protein